MPEMDAHGLFGRNSMYPAWHGNGWKQHLLFATNDNHDSSQEQGARVGIPYYQQNGDGAAKGIRSELDQCPTVKGNGQ